MYHFLLNLMRMALILSIPYRLPLSLEISSSSNSSMIAWMVIYFASLFLIHSTI